jgi:hypothetical protein
MMDYYENSNSDLKTTFTFLHNCLSDMDINEQVTIEDRITKFWFSGELFIIEALILIFNQTKSHKF